jgi:hypothetical protein
MHARDGATHFYVVGRHCDEVRTMAGGFFVQPGLLTTKLVEGRRHPFARALLHEDASLTSIVDGTLGLANDALHAACITGASVVGIEGSPVIASLLEEGLPRMAREGEAWSEAASRISLVHGRTVDVLRAMDSDSVDVVMLDPMMSKPKKSAPGFAGLREFAVHDRADGEVLHEAARVARRRVLLKLGKGAPMPPDAPYAFERAELGAHVIYFVHDLV